MTPSIQGATAHSRWQMPLLEDFPMPDRIIRDELLESERWLTLKDNADRLAYLALLLKTDTLGNFEAGEYRLLRLWRDFGINTLPRLPTTPPPLLDHNLVLPSAP